MNPVPMPFDTPGDLSELRPILDARSQHVLDLLPGRSAAPVRDWLAAHPSVAVVSRDRAGPYAEAARTGAPAAMQVADRWHLLVNASEALRSIVERHQSEIRVVASHSMPEPSLPPDPAKTEPVPETSSRRRDRCEAALRLHGEGQPTKEIARRLGASRNAVAAEDVRAFADLLHQDDPAGLTPWLEAAAAGELGGFVTGLRQDEDAVRAAIAEPWSNGHVEGQVNRLKLIKRSMYGRAKFDLLRQRVLHAA